MPCLAVPCRAVPCRTLTSRAEKNSCCLFSGEVEVVALYGKGAWFPDPFLVHDSCSADRSGACGGERGKAADGSPSTPRCAARAKRPTPMARKAFRDSGHFRARAILGAKPGRSRSGPRYRYPLLLSYRILSESRRCWSEWRKREKILSAMLWNYCRDRTYSVA